MNKPLASTSRRHATDERLAKTIPYERERIEASAARRSLKRLSGLGDQLRVFIAETRNRPDTPQRAVAQPTTAHF